MVPEEGRKVLNTLITITLAVIFMIKKLLIAKQKQDEFLVSSICQRVMLEAQNMYSTSSIIRSSRDSISSKPERISKKTA